MRFGDDAPPGGRRQDRGVETLSEQPDQWSGPEGSLSAKEHRPPRRRQALRHRVDLATQRAAADRRARDVLTASGRGSQQWLGYLHHDRPRLARGRQRHRLRQARADLLRRVDRDHTLDERSGDLGLSDRLQRVGAVRPVGRSSGDVNNRRRVEQRLGEPGQGVHEARSRDRHDDPHALGRTCVSDGHECGCELVGRDDRARQRPTTERLPQVDRLGARDAEHMLDAQSREGVAHRVGSVVDSHHQPAAPRRACRARRSPL